MASTLLDAPTQILDTDHERVGRWMHGLGAGLYRDGSTCIGLERHGVLVAGTMYDYFNGASIFANIAIQGPITRKWLWFIFHYPFIQLDAKVIVGLIAQDNLRSLNLAVRFGFTLHQPIPQAHPSGALMLITMQRDDCRFLRSPYV